MSTGLNRCTFVGHLGADPELRHTQGGASVLNIRIACTESWLDQNGQKQERTEWVQCVIWGKRGEGLSRVLHKGDRVLVEGGMRTESYEKNGEKRYTTKIHVNNVVLLGGGKREGAEAGRSQHGEREWRPSSGAPPERAPSGSSSSPARGQRDFGDAIPDDGGDQWGGDDIPF